MAEDREALLQHYRQMRAELLAAIDGLSDARLSEATLDGWSVKDHLLHLALWDELRASEVERISAGHDSAWRMAGEQDAVYNALAHELRLGLSPAQARWELARSHERLLAAIAAAGERGLDASRYGEAGLVSRHEAQHTGWIRRWRGEVEGGG
ncbi:MAG TPA: maleylpyruvate isomerase N-terminal domain-containing protein [Dehalococcoidia bacterium]|nr:maleylpyruvate isomerase N-terminal domain-containing protein [Dehalococcoidia bacterium]